GGSRGEGAQFARGPRERHGGGVAGFDDRAAEPRGSGLGCLRAARPRRRQGAPGARGIFGALGFGGFHGDARAGGAERQRLADAVALDRRGAIPGRAGNRAGRLVRRSGGGDPHLRRRGHQSISLHGLAGYRRDEAFRRRSAAPAGRIARTHSIMKLTFHWRLLQGGETANMTRAGEGMRRETGLPDLGRQLEFCRRAELCGITGLLTDIGATKPDPILLSAALGMATEKIEFIVAYRSGLIPPTTFVQQLNTLSSLIQGRFSLNIVAGHSPLEQRYYGDFLSHDERYPRTEEFLAICHAFWRSDEPVNFQGKNYQIE